MARPKYDNVEFDIEGPDDGFFPLMTLGIDGPPTITLTILLDSRNDFRDLYRLRSRVTPRVAIGKFSGRVVVHAGAGAKTLRLPTGADLALANYSAVLIDLIGSRHEFATDLYRADATWLILSDTP